MPYGPIVWIVATSVYARRARRLLSAAERAAAELELSLAPGAWPVVGGTGGCRKARVARAGMGRRGGARVIYFVLGRAGELHLLDIYAKNRKDDLTDDDKAALREAVRAIEQGP
jgi:hypothetical protein